MKKREYNYEWLRVCAMLAVIMIHVSAHWVSGFSAAVRDGAKAGELINPLSACIYNSICRFAVPCFLMISGAFIIDNDKNADYVTFYKKSFMKIGITTIIFSILYCLKKVTEACIGGYLGAKAIWAIVIDAISGVPYYHMWYLYMLIGVYMLAPFVIIIKNAITYKHFRIAAIVFLVYSIVSAWTNHGGSVSWDIGNSVYYFGYFMIGYVLRKEAKKDTLRGICLIAIGILVEIIIAFVEYHFQIVNGIAEAKLNFQIVSPLSPQVALASVLIFAGVSRIELNENKLIAVIAKMSFVIYIIHGGVWGMVRMIVGKLKDDSYLFHDSNIAAIPIFVIIVFVISFVLAIIYEKFYAVILKCVGKK